MAPQLTAAQHTQLWNAFREGDRAAFARLYDLFAADLYRYGYNLVRNRQVVEDCLHELFLHLHENRSRLGPTDNIRFYLFRALRRRLLDTVGRFNKLDSADYLFDEAQFLIQPHETALIAEELMDHQKRILIDELNRLPKRQKEILYLVYMKEMSYPQAAEVMGITLKSVYNTLNVSLAALRATMQQALQLKGALVSLASLLTGYFANN
ncbi:RNA polymerase, sigma-24 subunit, ECF subfamily [Fibrella aestuarina BUZ 2]|uniref:RNA polymerase, sigma-24 subunit, ECF subfamily n=1 Tax=Fibrella aestuarina BUZ 2 TaxID=1166018 RepID=I0K8F2_9BACT|nr:sigma-70 family RNA polymerase sigma factor [Fibrella aestuarina]CCH00405.1 RNA polymerase, sigma-24 subunit, ECF subfamily [Fibrella aestuarina BUZ 2]